MIDTLVYRFRVGVYNANTNARYLKRLKSGKRPTSAGSIFDLNAGYISSSILLYLFYILFIIYMSISLLMVLDISSEACPSYNRDFRAGLPSFAFTYNQVYPIYFIIHILNMYYIRNCFSFKGFLKFCHTCAVKNILVGGRIGKCLSVLVVWLFGLNIFLITVVNPGIVNPGPVNPGPGSNLKVYFQNVQGLIPFGELKNNHPMLDITKCLELSTYLKEYKIDIAILNETWLKKSILDSEILPATQYKIFRCDRSNKAHPSDPMNPKRFRRNGGGVLIAVRNDLKVTSKEIKLGGGAEIIAVEFTTAAGLKFIVCTCYRVGTLGLVNYDKIIGSLQCLVRRRKLSKIYVLGDFNLHDVSWDALTSNIPIEQSFIDSFVDLGLAQCIKQATHQKGNILDILLTNSETSIGGLSVLDKDSICRSDHFPIIFDIKLKVFRKKPHRRVCYNFKTANWDGLNHDLCHTNWNAMLSCTEPELGWKKFKHRLFELADLHIKKSTIKTDGQDPWFDSECHDLWRKKMDQLRKAKRTKSDVDKIKFSLSRKALQKLIAQKMRDNLNEDDDSALITKKFWSYVKAKSNSHRIPEFVNYKGAVRSSPEDQANMFNEFFYEQFSDASTYDITIDYSEDSRFDVDFDHTNIRKLLAKINTNKAHGPDGIHGKLLKNCAVGLAYPLSLLFRTCYNTGSIPEEWKLGHIVPIFKKGSKHEVSNYRPISLTSLVMKTLERLIKVELLKHVHELIDDRQHGFLSKKSCTTNLVGMCDSLALSLNDNIHTDVIYFDFAKAFDSVNHDLILHKLKTKFNVDGRLLKFLKNYLKDRQQRVMVSNKLSLSKVAKSGVPQGSILGPLLFVLFINDISDGISPGTQLSLYADDTKIWRSILTSSDNNCLQKDIDYLYDWSLRNKMKFHPGKCKVLSVTGKIPETLLSVLPFYNFVYSLGGESLDYVSSEKDLGVMVTSTFDWAEQCGKVYSKANQKLGLSRRTCHFVIDNNRRRILYLTLIRSQFEHCSVIWRPVSKTHTKRLEDLQKRAIKWILFEEYTSYTFTTYIQKCRQLNIMPLTDRFDFLDILFFYKVVKGIVPVELPPYLIRYEGNTRLRSSHLDHMCFVSSVTPRSTNNAFTRSFFFRTHTKWNHIPLSIREIDSISEFKHKLTKHMWKVIMTEVNDDVMELSSDDNMLENV